MPRRLTRYWYQFSGGVFDAQLGREAVGRIYPLVGVNAFRFGLSSATMSDWFWLLGFVEIAAMERFRLLRFLAFASGCFVIGSYPTAAIGFQGEPKKDAAAKILFGRIIDDSGKPVTDAELALRGPGRSYLAKTDENGEYSFPGELRPNVPPPPAGEYRLQIKSDGWVTEKNYRKLERFPLTPTGSVQRDIELKRAAQVQIRVVGEEASLVRVGAWDQAGPPLFRLLLLARPATSA